MTSNLEDKTTLVLTFNFPPQIGGIETLMYDIVSNYPGRVVVMAPWHPEAYKFDHNKSFEVLRIKTPQSTLARIALFTKHAIHFIRKNKVHHIQAANVFAGVAALAVSRISRLKYSVYALGKEVYILNTPLRSAPYKFILIQTLKHADKLLAISRFTADQLVQVGCQKEKVTIIPSGINTSKLDRFDEQEFQKFKSSRSSKMGLDGKRVILTVARLVERKGQDKVIEAMPTIVEKYSDCIYIIVGDGPEKKRLQQMVDKFDLKEHVFFTGKVSDRDVLNYYHLADIFVLASRLVEGTADVEGFGQVFLEANYCGLPVVGGRSGGIVDSVEDGKNGFLVNPNDPVNIAERLLELLSNQELRKAMARLGRQRVLSEYDQKSTVRAVTKALKDCYQ